MTTASSTIIGFQLRPAPDNVRAIVSRWNEAHSAGGSRLFAKTVVRGGGLLSLRLTLKNESGFERQVSLGAATDDASVTAAIAHLERLLAPKA